MKATPPNSETEIKLAVKDAASARRMLNGAGFRLHKRRVFERNVVFDTAGNSLRNQAMLLRLREAGGSPKLTFKGVPKPGKHKSREELELEVSDARMMTLILNRLGYQQVFVYEKYRAEYKQPKSGGVATVDETPIGVYLELEGSPAWIDRTARKLGFTEADYITSSYGRLYVDWASRQGVPPQDMVFVVTRSGKRRPKASTVT